MDTSPLSVKKTFNCMVVGGRFLQSKTSRYLEKERREKKRKTRRKKDDPSIIHPVLFSFSPHVERCGGHREARR